jgi:hypothetical protein
MAEVLLSVRCFSPAIERRMDRKKGREASEVSLSDHLNFKEGAYPYDMQTKSII